MKLVAVIAVALVMLFLVRRNLLQVDLSFPLFAAIVVLGFASMNEGFIDWIAVQLDIIYAPLAIILIAIAILLALITVLTIVLSHLRRRQLLILRYLVAADLGRQEARRMAPNRPAGAQ